MDDLDHSIHISEDDWSCFYVESEECCLLQPSLACPDHSGLSDSEDSGNSSPVFIAGPKEPQQGPDAKCDPAESNAAPWCMREMQINLSSSRKEQDDPSTKAKEDGDTQVNCEIGLDCPEGSSSNIEEVRLIWSAEHTTEEANHDTTTTLQTEQINPRSAHGEAVELKKDSDVLQTESDTCELKPVQKPDPLSFNQTEVIVNETHSTDRAEGEDESSVALRSERERWFVTVNDSPARQRAQRSSSKKKRRQKKTKDAVMCRSGNQENSEGQREGDSKGGGGVAESVPITEENPERNPPGDISDLVSSTSCEEDNSPEESLSSYVSRDNFTLHDAFTFKGPPPRVDSIESVDGAEFFSTHSYDSESYLSAPESMDEPQYPLVNKPSLQSSESLTRHSCPLDLLENTDTNNTQVAEIPLCDTTLSSSPPSTAASTKGYECTDVEATQMLPSVGESVNKMPDDFSACVNDTPSELPRISSNPSGVQKHEVNLPASACSSGDQLSISSLPDLTVTPCAVADSPETYAEATGNTQPVFAISAFWDEMEKLTINDILQLRMGRSPAPRDTQDISPPNDDFLTNPSSLEEAGDSFCSGGSTDHDTADSDYFTQVDDSKPDRSSCEFSTSDFEEEYWQFLGASRNTSPDPQSTIQRGTKDSPYFEEEESTCSEGKETPVPLEDCTEHLFQDQDTRVSKSTRELVWPSQITKSKSVHNVAALMEESSLQLILHDDSGSFLRSCPSLVEDVVLEASDSLEKLMSTVCISDTQVLDDFPQVSLSEVFENPMNDQTITLYDPEDFSSVPVFDCTSCSLTDNQTSLSFLHDSERSDRKLIPIFSCSQPTIRELAFPNPNYVFLSSDYNEASDVSPIRVVSHAFIQSTNLGASAATLSGFPSLLSMRRITLHNRGSTWSGSSGAWVFPVKTADNDTIRVEDQPLPLLAKRTVPTTSSQFFRELEEHQGILGTFRTTRREGIFSTLKQSDMCLVCIAFASWVLRSSDPEAADAWKAALLANVSALSAIQYLRQYLKKKPSQNDP